MNHRRALALSIWLAGLLACILVIAQTRFVADLSAFLPKPFTLRQLAERVQAELKDAA